MGKEFVTVGVRNYYIDEYDKLNLSGIGLTDITEIEGLENLTKLKSLYLSRNQIKEIKGLETLTKLEVLDLQWNEIEEIKGLEHLTNIQRLDLGYNLINEINGLDQLPKGVECANGILVQRHGDYYLAITTYQAKKKKTPPFKTVGIDFGLATQLTLSTGIAIRYAIPLSTSKRLRKLHQKLSRQQFRNQSWYKTKCKLEKAYAKVNNIKHDIKNKLVHYLQVNYRVVCYQDENLKGWQRLWGGKMLSTAIGGIIRMLETKMHTPIKVNRFFPSTKTCSRCGNIRQIGLDERIYVCPVCGNVMDRDHNSSVNLEHEGLTQAVGMVRTEFTPVETESSTLASLEYLNSIPYVKASSVVEAGSLIAFA